MNEDVLNWFQNDELFFRECREGHKWQTYVGEYLKAQGLPVVIAEQTFRGNPNVSEYTDEEAKRWAAARQKSEMARTEYTNAPDLLVCSKVVEVKSRDLKFTKPDDFPFSQIFVDTVDGYERKERKPALYVCVSQITGAMICALGKKADHWTKLKVRDSKRQLPVLNYAMSWRYWHPIEWAVRAFTEMRGN